MSHKRVITLTTDFGLADHYVGVMKGVMLGINPEAQLVDLSHDVRSHSIEDGAFTLAQSYRYFPGGTIHLVVVDPGVGSARRPILATTPQAAFVAPDNGVLTMVYEREPEVEVRHVTADRFFLKPVSRTFHGRDIFAPVAGWLSRGIDAAGLETFPSSFGDLITDYVRLPVPKPERLNRDLVCGAVLHVDKFGNIITNLTPADVPELFASPPAPFRLRIGVAEITLLHASYAEALGSELFVLVGSSGFLEVAMKQGSAARALGVGRGAEVQISVGGI